MAEDKTLTCRDCACEFVFTASEQDFFAEKGFANEPSRCPSCRAARRQRSGLGDSQREMHDVICADCGASTQVPFVPRGDRPVYCSDCFRNHRR
jgi:CxxC-x17-CxxC domain-containing protein